MIIASRSWDSSSAACGWVGTTMAVDFFIGSRRTLKMFPSSSRATIWRPITRPAIIDAPGFKKHQKNKRKDSFRN